ncbi:glycosyl hydrolase, partial [Teichococcus oryzae]
LKNTPGDGPIMVRTGWEANGDWFFWNAIGKEEAFKGAFRQMSSTFKEVSDRFQFEWNVNHANGGLDPAKIYPGDEYVDVIGMDFYYKPEFQGSDPVKAFERIRDEKYGLKWLEEFAKAHGKPTAYSEWGVKGDGAAPFVQAAKAWFEQHDPILQSYWDSDAAFPGKLSDGSDPKTGAAFKAAFKNWGTGDMTWTEFGGRDGSVPPSAPAMPDKPTQNGGDETAGKPPGADDPVVVAPSNPAPSNPLPVPAPAQPGTGGSTIKEISGTAAKETLSGTAGNDLINGGGGDTLKGGAGDDTYVISTGDIVVELGGQGTDTVKTWINNYVLPDNVENLVLTGTGWNTLFGNGLANRIEGNLSANTLNGKGGHDVLTGGGGNDTFVIAKGEGSDIVTDFRGADVIKLDGFAFKDFAAVKAAAVQSGADTLIRLGDGQTLTLQGVQAASLAADDFSLVNIKAPVLPPAAETPVALPDSGAPTKWLYGTAKAETLTGSAGRDGFKGNGGGDTLKGGAGDDTYVVYAANDKVVEFAVQGIDTVETWLSSYVLPDNVENLFIGGTSWTEATGNSLANRMVGNVSQNVLDGKDGHDVLTGGGGNDTFVITKGLGHDVITDFQDAGRAGGDTLLLKGFGQGATMTHQGDEWSIRAADGSVTHLTIDNVTSLAASDYAWG